MQTLEDNFVKNIEFYLNTTFDDYSINRIKFYLDEYVKSLPKQKPIIIREDRIVFRTVVAPKPIGKTKKENKICPKKILETVSLITGISVKYMLGKSRNSEVCLPRHIVMYLIRDINDCTLTSIAELFNRDHTTVLYSITHVRNMLESKNKDYVDLMDKCNNELFPTKKVKIA